MKKIKKINDGDRKNFVWNMIGSTFSAFNSFFFMIIVTRINGVNDAGIFTLSFSLACLFQVIGLYSGRTYQVTEINKKISDSDYFYLKIISCIFMIVVSVCYCIIKHYNLYKNLVILFLVLFKMLEALSEYFYALMQCNNKLYKVGQSLILKSVFALLLFFILDLITNNLIVSELMIVIIYVLIIIFYDCNYLKKIKFKLTKFNKNNIILLFKNGFYAFGFSFLTLYIINAQKYILDTYASNRLQTIFGIVIMPATIMILLVQFIIQPFLMKMKESLKNNKYDFRSLINKISLYIFVVGLFVLFVAIIMGIPVLNIVYGLKLNGYKLHLIIILIGAVFYGISINFSTALTTMRKTFVQLVIFLIVSVFTYIFSTIMINSYSLLGASISYMMSMLLLLILYVIIFNVLIIKYDGK